MTRLAGKATTTTSQQATLQPHSPPASPNLHQNAHASPQPGHPSGPTLPKPRSLSRSSNAAGATLRPRFGPRRNAARRRSLSATRQRAPTRRTRREGVGRTSSPCFRLVRGVNGVLSMWLTHSRRYHWHHHTLRVRVPCKLPHTPRSPLKSYRPRTPWSPCGVGRGDRRRQVRFRHFSVPFPALVEPVVLTWRSALGSLLTFALLMPSLFLLATIVAHRIRIARYVTAPCVWSVVELIPLAVSARPIVPRQRWSYPCQNGSGHRTLCGKRMTRTNRTRTRSQRTLGQEIRTSSPPSLPLDRHLPQ